MVEIVEKQELPVTITKVKIGKKDLSKKIIDQLPIGIFVSHKNSNNRKVYGLPIKLDFIGDYHDTKEIIVLDKDKTYELDGTLIGYVNLSDKEIHKIKGDVLKYAEKLTVKIDGGYYDEYENFKGKFYFILWYTIDNKLKKSVVDKWTLDQLGIDIINLQLFI